MSANLNVKEGKTSFAGTLQAWHKSGQVMPNGMTVDEACEESNQNYKVEKRPIYAINPKALKEMNDDKSDSAFIKADDLKRVENQNVTFRTDTNEILGYVSDSYKVIQNRKMFEIFSKLFAKAGQEKIETAGVLGKGERYFMSSFIPNSETEILAGDKLEDFLLAVGSHDNSKRYLMFCRHRVECQNLLNLAIQNMKTGIIIPNTINTNELEELAEDFIVKYANYKKQTDEVFKRLTEIKIDSDIARELINKLFVSETQDSTKNTNIRNGAYVTYLDRLRAENLQETGWSFYNGITYYTNHIKEHATAQRKFESLTEGWGFKTQNKAVELLLNL